MKRRNWALLSLCALGLAGFILSRTVWGPPSKAAASESHSPQAIHEPEEFEEMSDAQRRYISGQPRHWRYVMLKTQ